MACHCHDPWIACVSSDEGRPSTTVSPYSLWVVAESGRPHDFSRFSQGHGLKGGTGANSSIDGRIFRANAVENSGLMRIRPTPTSSAFRHDRLGTYPCELVNLLSPSHLPVYPWVSKSYRLDPPLAVPAWSDRRTEKGWIGNTVTMINPQGYSEEFVLQILDRMIQLYCSPLTKLIPEPGSDSTSMSSRCFGILTTAHVAARELPASGFLGLDALLPVPMGILSPKRS